MPPRYRTTYFAHIWGGGYRGGYYAYLWSEVLDHDAYYWFKENGGMTRANGQRFRDMILSRGGTQEAGCAVPRVPRTRSERRAVCSSSADSSRAVRAARLLRSTNAMTVAAR